MQKCLLSLAGPKQCKPASHLSMADVTILTVAPPGTQGSRTKPWMAGSEDLVCDWDIN